MPPREDASGDGGGTSAASPPKPALPLPAKVKEKAKEDDVINPPPPSWAPLGCGTVARSTTSPPKPAPPLPAKGKEKAKRGDLPEEDLALKQLLEQSVLRVQDSDPAVQKRAIATLRHEIRAATSSMTAIPQPLKVLRRHYGTLKTYFETMPESDMKTCMADILSVLAFTMCTQGERESLKYCMMGSKVDICSWGHAYVRNLAGEIADEFHKDDSPNELLIGLVQEIAKFHMKHNTEPEAVDILMEIEDGLEALLDYADLANYRRTCLYITSCSKYLPTPDDLLALHAVYNMYTKFGDFANALRIGLLLDDSKYGDHYVKKVFMEVDNFVLKQQFAYMIAAAGFTMEIDDEISTDKNEKETLQNIVNNTKLSEGYLTVARDIKVMEPKSPSDVYKVHLIDGRCAPLSNLGSTRQFLAAPYVNAFVNAGFGQDKFMTVPSEWRDKFMNATSNFTSDGSCINLPTQQNLMKASVAASMGMIFLWDSDSGIALLEKYLHSNDNYVVAGTLLGIGIVACGVKNNCDREFDLISKYTGSNASIIRIGAILALGISYAGSQKDELKEHLSFILSDSRTPLEELIFSAISLGLVFVGSCNTEIMKSITFVLMDRSKTELRDPLIHLLPVALGLLYLGKQERVEATADELSKLSDETLKKYCDVTLKSLAYAGTGNVLMVQELIGICSEHLEKGETHQGPAVLGMALIAMAEDIGSEMAVRTLGHFVQYGDQNTRRAVPLALGMLYISNPQLNIMKTLNRLSHDADGLVSMAAIISLGLIGAGTNNAAIARLLRTHSKFANDDSVFCVRIAQGLVHLGKGLLTLDPYHSDRLLLSRVALAGIVTVVYACLDIQSTILGKYPYMLYIIVLAMQPKMLLTVDEDFKPLNVPVHVGQRVDVTGQAGQPRTITGFQTHNTPVLLAAGERAELATRKYIPLTPVLEGFVVLRKNPKYSED